MKGAQFVHFGDIEIDSASVRIIYLARYSSMNWNIFTIFSLCDLCLLKNAEVNKNRRAIIAIFLMLDYPSDQISTLGKEFSKLLSDGV